jgi:hypothetical protein
MDTEPESAAGAPGKGGLRDETLAQSTLGAGGCPGPTRDARLLARALRQGWTTPEKGRQIMDRMAEIALDPKQPVRTAIAAARVYATGGQIDAQAERSRVQEQGKDATVALELLRQRIREEAQVQQPRHDAVPTP